MLEKINELELKLDIRLSQHTAYTNELANKIELVETKITQSLIRQMITILDSTIPLTLIILII